jgi:hypothetical protein
MPENPRRWMIGPLRREEAFLKLIAGATAVQRTVRVALICCRLGREACMLVLKRRILLLEAA